MSLSSVVQSPAPGDRVTLFRLDATSVGGAVYYFAQAAYETTGITFGGVYYTPVDVEFSDFETAGAGSLPTPSMRVANSNQVFQALVNSLGDMLGCVIQRVRTFRRFLDGQPEADPTAFFGPDTFRIEMKKAENPIFIEWVLSAAIDQEGKMLPGRQVIRDTCMWRYRHYDATAPNRAGDNFVYAKTTCPYAGGSFFDALGNPCAPASDQCGKRLSDCELRYGVGNPLPFGGFPGAGRAQA